MGGSTNSFSVRAGICSLTDQDGTTILDSTKDKIYSVIGLGSLIWQELEGSLDGLTAQDIVGKVSARFRRVPQDQIEEDVNRVLLDFQKKGLVRPSQSDTHSFVPASRDWITVCFVSIARQLTRGLLETGLPVLAAFAGLFMVDLILRTAGFGALYRVVEKWPFGCEGAASGAQREICDATSKAIAWYPKQAMCLQMSAVTTCLLRTRNLPARMVIGCRRIPFKAHAWVEVGGSVVTDKDSVQKTFSVLSRA